MPGELKFTSKKVTTSVPEFREGFPKEQNGKPVKVRVRAKKLASVPEFEPTEAGLNQAIDYYKEKGGVKYVVDLFNTQNLTDEMNAIRKTLTPGTPGEEKLSQMAMQQFYDAIAKNPGGPEFAQLQKYVGDPAGLAENVLKPIKEQIKAGYGQGASDLFEIDTDDDGD